MKLRINGTTTKAGFGFRKTTLDCICKIWRIEGESHDCTNLTELKKKKIGQAETENRNNAHAASNSSILLSCNNLNK